VQLHIVEFALILGPQLNQLDGFSARENAIKDTVNELLDMIKETEDES